MEKIFFFSDSPADLLPEQTVGMPYKMVSSSVIYDDGHTIRETEVDRQEYYEYLRTCKNIPSHAMGTPEQWSEALNEAVDGGYTHAIICTISSTASSVFQSINVARELLEAEKPGALTIELIDSHQYSMMYGRLILKSLAQIMEGRGFQDVVDELKTDLRRTQAVVGAYSLRCMQKSGRISGMAAFAGSLMGIKPVLLARDGSIAPIDKARGSKNLVPSIVSNIKQRIVDPESQDLIVLHGSVPVEELDRLEAMLHDELKIKSITLHPIGVTVVTNSGPETIVVGFFGEPY